jgi:hypothetical protein
LKWRILVERAGPPLGAQDALPGADLWRESIMDARSGCMLAAMLAFLGSAISFSGEQKQEQTADQVLVQYLRAVQQEVGRDPKSLGYEGALKRLHELGEKYLLPNKAVLHRKASADYMKLDEFTAAKIGEQERIAWDSADKYQKGNTITPPDPKANKVGSFIVAFIEGGYDIPPYDRHTRATTWWNPLTAARTLRALALKTLEADEAFQKRGMLEGLVEPMVYRLSSDAEAPSIGFSDGKELFVLDLKYTDVGIYSLQSIRWVRLKQ